jgi:hypothetical protein
MSNDEKPGLPEKELRKREEWMREHLRYEIIMLNATHRLLDWSDSVDLLSPVIVNALIESYCVHARLLIILFRFEAKKDKEDDKARLALTEGWSELAHDYKDYADKLNDQIAHLGERKSASPDKVNRRDRVELTKWLRDDLAMFKKRLKPRYATFDVGDIDDPSASSNPSAMVVSFGGPGRTTSTPGVMLTTRKE